MRLRVRRIHELSGDEGVRCFRRQFFSQRDGAFHAFRSGGERDLRAVSFHQAAPFDGHRFGHGEDYPVTPGSRDGSKTDAGIAARGLDDHGVFREFSGLFGIVQHGFRDAVLDGPGRVEILKFRDKFRLEPFGFLHMAES